MSARAFSVVEFIVIIAMVGLVIAVGAPAFLRHQAISDARACQENLARMEGALEAVKLQAAETTNPTAAPGTPRVDLTALTLDDLVDTTGTGMLATAPKCPAGGHYTLTRGHIACSIAQNPAATYAPHIYSTRLPYTKTD